MMFKMVLAFKSVIDEIMNYCLFVWSSCEQAKVFGQYFYIWGRALTFQMKAVERKIPLSPFTALCIWLLFYILKLKSLK